MRHSDSGARVWKAALFPQNCILPKVLTRLAKAKAKIATGQAEAAASRKAAKAAETATS
jgi:hypothetical protein